ncbi:BEAS beauvericin nonribosomal cyclodepsipeptide synthetase [Cordyceps fumosorosea ARSEF 2679]|uniref:BEAS beauvericin nonribosomal cyclodepsipeptide synthetase n=1 Tax=Cordyceps fumosorosea (strain ARSEF 2679) TaxID=1081104 RepID=A0A168E1R4_CORFA|nr:BEAS beauvericin nonribosomal cyclodepsipeptide synthetase [Cordyceps fumosorosea ARSEF 2679]OAA73278.1 BEAS beauvericin nonribosomal cyclodepsipeptide synthetase [Cordyceps fumosorosea ARSEF 2679]
MGQLSDVHGSQPDLNMPSFTTEAEISEHLYLEVGQRLGLAREAIETILPCKPLQRDVLDSAVPDAHKAVGHAVYRVPADVDVPRLVAAWRETARRTAALRACALTSQDGVPVQVVLKESFVFSRACYWASSPDPEAAVVRDEAAAAVAGPRCNRLVLVEGAPGQRQLLVWTFSRALVDAPLRARVLRRVAAAYKEGDAQRSFSLPATPESPRSRHSQEDLTAARIPQAPDAERAKRFWHDELRGLDAPVFPHLSSSHLSAPDANARAEHRISYPADVQRRWSDTTVCRAALAILLSRYTHLSEALFGVVTEQSRVFEERRLLIDGPTRTVVPFRVGCAADRTASEFMDAVAACDRDVRQFAHVGLGNIGRIGEDQSAACGFQTVLLVTDGHAQEEAEDQLHELVEASGGFAPCENRALLLRCETTSEDALLVAKYDQSVIEPLQMTRFLRQLAGLINQLQSASSDTLCLGLLDTVTPEDRVEIESWNSEPLQTQDILVHSKILGWAAETPSSPAVSAWDGEWTYSELDEVSSRLAAHIRSLNSGPGQLIVPVYFEKSKWMVASILAVLKAGHAFTLIDPKDPPARTAQIVQQTSATIALTSKLHRSTVQAILGDGHVIVVDDDLLQSLPRNLPESTPPPKPDDLAYVIFTSGSTGNPKGIMIEHRAFASCVARFGPALGIHTRTRTLQFAAHGFGACLLETLTPLTLGGCVCVPSDHERLHALPDFSRRAGVDWLMATPSYATTLKPEDVPGLRTLVLVGEQMSAAVNDVWAPRVRLLDGYGQGESSSICFVGAIGSDPDNMGRPVGAHAWIADPEDPDRLAPIGAVGELLIESPGVARGYIAAPAGDAVPFLEEPPKWYAPREMPRGVKFYRTGDLARYAADGTVVCLGRVDSQVKIRGQRVEISAVETRLRQHLPGDVTVVAEAVKRSDAAGSTVITAFLMSPSMMERNGADVKAAEGDDAALILGRDAVRDVDDKLRQVLPPHSVPTCYVCMNALPRTATGKVDRRRLRSIGSNLLAERARGASSQAQPSRDVAPVAAGSESKLKDVWMQIFSLGSDSLNAGASFFELGGDSITAIKMVNMARAAGIELKISDIFQNPTLARLQDALGHGSTRFAGIPASAWSGPVEQSYSQGRLWFLDQLDMGAVWYLIPYAVRMRGPLQIDALQRALLALERRHETLRTTFENQDGVGVQIVHEKLAKELRIINLLDRDEDYVEALQREQTTPFDLTSEAGWRASLICLGDDEHVLSIVMHHIVSDGWSIDVLRRELGLLYAAALRGQDPTSALPPMPIQYRDFSAWQRRDAQAAEHERQLIYWRAQLADCSPARLPADFARPALLSGSAGVVPVSVTGTLFQQLRTFCHALDATPFVVLLAAFRAAHYRLTGAEDAVVGTPIANRNRPELEGLIGFFVNTQCMRIAVDGDGDTFEGLVRRVKDTATAAFEHEDVPFERVVSAMMPSGSRDLSQNPLAQLIFAVHSQRDLGRFELEGLESEPVASKAYTRFDAEFHLFHAPDGLTGYLNYAPELFRPETMRNVVDVFFQILRHGLDRPQTRIAVLPLADGVEELDRLGLVEIDRVAYQRDASMVDIFRAQASASPDAVAVVDAAERLTYAELDRRSDLLETWLRRRGLPAEALVGVLSPRSCETVVAFLGILKANLAYLPLDVKSPIARMRDILSTLPENAIVLLGSDVAAPEFGLPGLRLARISDALEHSPTANETDGNEVDHTSKPSATSLAYVLYTSGSTGRPKGVMVEHRSIVRLVRRDVIPNFPPPQGAVMAHLFNTVFDGATYEIFLMLLNGGTLVCVDYMTTLSPQALTAVFAKERVNSAIMTPALLKLYLADARDALRGLDMLMVAGDRFDPQDATDAQNLVRGQCYNAYGPTENGVMSTLYAVDTADSFINGVPLGRAISNSGAYITDPDQQLVGPGIMGELVVTGDGLARGYTDPALDEDRFVQLTVNGQTVKAYRTGDRMRYRVGGEGVIEFFGRMDFQFKIRGNRIESAEVEAAMLSHPLVRDAAAVLRVEEQQQPELIGFVVADEADSAVERAATDADQVEQWQDLIEGTQYADIAALDPAAVGRDFTGWTSMYDGSDIDRGEMREWLADTIATLRDGDRAPPHVLEIGTGTGMMLFNLGDGVQSYVGLEPTPSAAAFVNRAIQATPALAGKARVHLGTAADVHRLAGPPRPDTLVVLNSVVQYFPSVEYLGGVVDALLQLPGVQRIFFGDVRSQATNRQFLAARAVHALGRDATREGVRGQMEAQEEREDELLVEPAFFTGLAARRPDRVRHVEVLPKNMRATNELSAYRYAAVVHLVDDADAETRPVHPIAADDWVDFQASQMHRDALREYLRLADGDAATVAVANIPYSKTIVERLVVESLDDEDATTSLDGAAWISAVRADAKSRASLSMPDLAQLAEECGFRVQVSAARQWSQSGALDAVFHRLPAAAAAACRTLFQFPTDDAALLERVRGLVPSYMVPAHLVALERMPLNANGKVDRKELARRAQAVQKSRATKISKPAPVEAPLPLSDVEAVLCEEATATFGMEVGVGDHFFKIGGHSLLATRLIARVGDRLRARLTVKDVFDHPVLSDLAAVIQQGLAARATVAAAADGDGPARGGAGTAPRTDMERMLCEEFAHVLGVDDVGITDNFFDLGGHSLMATKLAARIGHRLDTTISVKDVFSHPLLFELATKLELAGSKSYEASDDIQMADYVAFQLLSVEDVQGFIRDEIRPRLGFAHGTIQDVYPATYLQKTFLCDTATGVPKPLVPFYIDFPPGSDPATLVQACSSLVERFDLFRTVFVEVSGEFYQVVLDHLEVPINIIETAENVHTATSDLVDKLAEEPVLLGQRMMHATILKHASSSRVRLLLWLSHALYDGLSLEHIVRDLHMLYQGQRLPVPTQFSRYMQYVAQTRADGRDFWRDVIQKTPITVLGDAERPKELPSAGTARTLHAGKIISLPPQAVRNRSSITQATVFNAACALVLSRESGGSADVVFSRIVSGRQGLPVAWQGMVGLCTNAVPVHARVDDGGQQMLRDLQDQYLLSLPFETLGFDEVKRTDCADWPATANSDNYPCCVTYHEFSYHPTSEAEGGSVELGVLAKKEALQREEPLYDLGIAGEVEPDGVHLQVTVVARARLFDQARATQLVEAVCEAFEMLNASL